jgi:hypothetical protein
MKLSKAIIKKYGITKKAWQVARGKTHNTPRRVKTKTRRVQSMARRRKQKKSYSKRSGSSWIADLAIEAAPLAYGFVRKNIGDGIQTAAQKVNINSPYADEAVMFTAGALGSMIKNPVAKKLTSKLRAIELERMGELARAKVPILAGAGQTLSGMTYY